MGRLLVYLAIFVGCLIALPFLNSDDGPFAVVSGIAIGLLIPIVDRVLALGIPLRFLWYSLTKRRKELRISVAYLFRIRVDGKYLLVRGRRYQHYQPVGGVYKAHQSSRSVWTDLDVRRDSLLPVDGESEDDLRVRVYGRHLLGFMEWVESGKNREVDGWREFHDELVLPGIVTHSNFQYIAYEVVGRTYRPLRYSSHAQSYELQVADIFELLPTDSQVDEFRKLMSAGDSRYVWVSEEQIKRRGAVPGEHQPYEISEVSSWII